ncbi:SET and MYND domain-containing protein 5 [Perkinsus olseni]|uniref:SET and MYND domain-containing protein 5 n=1 Tax=Perkinsus olseni TaxID=32597 RepID=A0A7J6P2Y3_PEROL|nr:SET and MYND domain-containing protein 5 [Perkinsus olseni]
MGHADLPRLFQEWQRRHPEDYGALSLRKSTACSGLGVFATTDVAEGDILYEDRHPLVSMQFAYSRYSGAICCQHCLCSIGKLSEAFDHVLDLKNMSLEEDFPTLGADIIWLDSLMQCPACIPCSCGEVQYCSEDCRRLAEPGHARLCANAEIRHGLQDLALKYNEFFMLAAQAASIMVSRVQESHWTVERALSEFLSFSSGPVLGKTDGGVQESYDLIIDLFPDDELAEFRERFTVDEYIRLLGVFEVNNMLINYDHPSVDLLQATLRCPRGAALSQNVEWVRLVELIRRLVPYDDECAASLSPFPEVLGSGLYRGVALTNHSCSPNAEASFGTSRSLQVKALKALRAGDEVLQSYIDENLPLVERQTKLREAYGFHLSVWEMSAGCIGRASSAARKFQANDERGI